MKTWILALVILLGAGGYYGYQYWQKQKAEQEEEAKQKAGQEEEAKQKTGQEEEAKQKAGQEESNRKEGKEEKEESNRKEEKDLSKHKAEDGEADKRKAEEGETDKRKAEKAQDRPDEGEDRSEAEKLEARQEAWKQAEKMTNEEKVQLIHSIVEGRVGYFTVRLLFIGSEICSPKISKILEEDPESRTAGDWNELKKFQEDFSAQILSKDNFLMSDVFSMTLKKRPEERSKEENEKIEMFQNVLAILQKNPEERTETEKGVAADFETLYDLFFFIIRSAFITPAKYRSKEERRIVTFFEPMYDKWLSAVLDGVCDVMPLDIDKTNNKKLSPEFLRQSEERARIAYPVSDEVLKARLSAEAEQKFPVYHVGEVVTVYHAIYGGTFDKLTGKFRREEPKFVWIGDKKIAKAKLREDIAPRFDQNRIEKLKKEYVEQGILNYSRARSLYESKLNEAELRNIRGYLWYGGKWSSPRKAVAQILHDTVYGKPGAPKPPDPLRRKRKARRTVDMSSPFHNGGVLGRTHGKRSMLH